MVQICCKSYICMDTKTEEEGWMQWERKSKQLATQAATGVMELESDDKFEECIDAEDCGQSLHCKEEQLA